MRKYALLSAAALMAVAGTAARADFVFSTARTTIDAAYLAANGGSPTSPMLGDDLVVLSVIQSSGTAQTGTVISSVVSMSSIAASPTFFIRTFNGSGKYDSTVGANNKFADFGDQGTLGTAKNSFRPDIDASYSNFGQGSATYLSSVPAQNPPNYSDYAGVPSFTVTSSIGGTTGADDSTLTELAQAVVPHGQGVTFAGTLSSFSGTLADAPFSVSNGVVNTPEPMSLSAVGLGVVGLLARRRRTA